MAARKVAFFDVDGTLVRTNLVHAFAYYAINRGGLVTTALATARTALSVPLFWATDKVNRFTFNEIFFRHYRGHSEDRIACLAEDLFEDVLKPAILPGSARLVEAARRAGFRIVFCSGALDMTIAPLARHLEADDVIANRMRFLGGVATGRIEPPLVEGAHKAALIRQYCARHGFDLEEAHAYSDSFSDYPMLAVVGHPTAVNPDAKLERFARQSRWPVIETR